MTDSVIQFEGTIYEDGYGLLAQKVMRDKRLHKNAKLIYAYMCSFAGIKKDGKRTAFPSVSLQCDELGMSEDTYYKYRKQLLQYGYIKITKQRKEGAKFDNNLYSIVAVPIEVKEESKEIEPKEDNPYPKKSGMEPHPKNPGTENPCTEDSGTNSNSFNSNSFNSFEEEEEIITLDSVVDFINEQIVKRQITNPKTIDAIMTVVDQCRAINTTDVQAMKNYCITIVEEKMKKFGQKQKATGSRGKQSVRTEHIPADFDKPQPTEVKPATGEKQKKTEELLKQLRQTK